MRTGLMLLEALRREMHSEKHASTLNEFVIKKMHWIKAIEDIQYLFNKAADEAALLSSSESTSEQVNMGLDDNACGYHDGIDIQYKKWAGISTYETTGSQYGSESWAPNHAKHIPRIK